MGNVFRGTPEPLRQSYTESYDPETGSKKNWTWKNFSEREMRAYAARYQARGCATELTFENDICTLEVRDTTGEVTIDRWEVDAQQVNKSSLFNPLNIAAVGLDNLRIIARMSEGLNSTDAIIAIADESGDTLTWSPTAEATRLLDRMKRGETDYEVDQYTLVHTTNVSNRYQNNVSDFGKGQLYTTTQLLTETTDPTFWIYPLPGRLVYKIQVLAADAAIIWPAPSNYDWRWLKSASTERSAANNRIDITTIYKFDLYSLDEFPSY